ncbi:MAG TPA: hypothetical protein PKX73_00005, partial [Anaerohalosphaeraceae bacterium]|nr:hypothetical protein [Anaerohalosphaeraceae bacterium]
ESRSLNGGTRPMQAAAQYSPAPSQPRSFLIPRTHPAQPCPPPADNPRPARRRLSPTQKAFLADIFHNGRTLTQARTNLRLRPLILHNWLQSPLFRQTLHTFLTGYRRQARLVALHRIPVSLGTMLIFTETQNPKHARRASLDIWQTYRTFCRSPQNKPSNTNPQQEFPMDNHPAPQNPPRLTRKQQWFLETVLDVGCPLEQAMTDGRITPRLLHSWLQQPRFLHAVEIRMAQYRLETRIEAARAACQAVHTLARITAHASRYDIVRQAGMDLVKIHHDLENEKPPQPMAQKSPSPLNSQQFSPQPLNPSPLAQESASQLNSQQFPPNPLSSPFQLAQKCAPTPPQVQNPALKCARPFLSGFKMRADCAPRCANFPKNPIFSTKTHKTPLSHFSPQPKGMHSPQELEKSAKPWKVPSNFADFPHEDLHRQGECIMIPP